MNNIKTKKESLRKEIRSLKNQLEEQKVIYRKRLESAQKGLEEFYLEMLIEEISKLNKKLNE